MSGKNPEQQTADQFIDGQIILATGEMDRAEKSADRLSWLIGGAFNVGNVGVVMKVLELKNFGFTSADDAIVTGYGLAVPLLATQLVKNSKADRYAARVDMLEGHKKFTEEYEQFQEDEGFEIESPSEEPHEPDEPKGLEIVVIGGKPEIEEEDPSLSDRIKAKYKEAKTAAILAGVNGTVALAMGTLALDQVAESNGKNIIGSADYATSGRPGLFFGISAVAFTVAAVGQGVISRLKKREIFGLETEEIVEKYHQMREQEALAAA